MSPKRRCHVVFTIFIACLNKFGCATQNILLLSLSKMLPKIHLMLSSLLRLVVVVTVASCGSDCCHCYFCVVVLDACSAQLIICHHVDVNKHLPCQILAAVIACILLCNPLLLLLLISLSVCHSNFEGLLDDFVRVSYSKLHHFHIAEQ